MHGSMDKYSPKLKDIVKEIEIIFRKHDVGGLVILNDGEGFGEYRLFIEEPTWSMVRLFPDKKAVHLKAYAKSKPKETNMTVNMIYNQLDVLGTLFLMLNQIKQSVDRHMKVEVEDGDWYHGG